VPPGLPAAVEVVAYLIGQEAVANSVRHAAAGRITVTLTPDDGDLLLEVRDDGRGLPEDPGGGVGLGSMRERAEEIGGSFAAGPAPDGGTSEAVRLPLRAAVGAGAGGGGTVA
jgi:signal transduction histidine kinase